MDQRRWAATYSAFKLAGGQISGQISLDQAIGVAVRAAEEHHGLSDKRQTTWSWDCPESEFIMIGTVAAFRVRIRTVQKGGCLGGGNMDRMTDFQVDAVNGAILGFADRKK